jgi:Tfp pilus assembly protein PilZ
MTGSTVSQKLRIYEIAEVISLLTKVKWCTPVGRVNWTDVNQS